ISALPGAVESKATQRPSGDQRGRPVSGPPKCVSCRRLRPSLSAIQISSDPVRLLRNAIEVPSGDISGLVFRKVEAITGEGLPGLVRDAFQMFTLFTSEMNARRLLPRATAGAEA